MLTLATALTVVLGMQDPQPPGLAGAGALEPLRLGSGSSLLQEEPGGGGARFRFSLDFGTGKWEHETEGTLLDADADAGFFRFRGEVFSEKGFGGGLAIEGIGTDDDLFEDDPPNRSEANVGDVYGYFGYELQTKRFTCPFRAGLAARSYELENEVSGAETDFRMGSLRFQAEPDFALVRTDDFRWSLFALVSLAVGGGEIETDPGITDDEVTTFQHGFEIGTRFLFGNARLGIAYVARDDYYRDSTFADVDAGFSGGLLSFGVVF